MILFLFQKSRVELLRLKEIISGFRKEKNHLTFLAFLSYEK